MLTIPKKIHGAIFDQSKKDAPIETCGYLAGKGTVVSAIYPMVNVDKSPEHYSFDPQEQFKVVKEVRGKNLELLAVYHSHPVSPARLSQEDLRLANDPTMAYLICSLSENEIKGFRVKPGKVVETVPLTVEEEPGPDVVKGRAEAARLREETKGLSTQELIAFFLKKYGNRIALSASTQAPGQVITDMMMKIDPKSRVFMLDTGRLHQETYDTVEATMAKYGMKYEVMFPDFQQVEKMVAKSGPNLFYESVDNRKLCCHIRKTEPLKRILKTLDAWFTGLNRKQGETRAAVERVEWDEVNGLIKVNPLAEWSHDQIWSHIREHGVPYNKLHDQGFPSIGCAPCTRAVRPGEDARSGRWWWELNDQKECGIHVKYGTDFQI